VSREKRFSRPLSPTTSPVTADDDYNLRIDLRLNLDEIAEVEALELRRNRPKEPTRKELCRLACRIYDARRKRNKMLDRKLFGEPAWDMLLALYCLPARGEMLTTTGLTHAADVPHATGARWQAVLESHGLVERGPDELDARKRLLRLTRTGRSLMENYLTRLYYCDTPVPPHPEVHDD